MEGRKGGERGGMEGGKGGKEDKGVGEMGMERLRKGRDEGEEREVEVLGKR